MSFRYNFVKLHNLHMFKVKRTSGYEDNREYSYRRKDTGAHRIGPRRRIFCRRCLPPPTTKGE